MTTIILATSVVVASNAVDYDNIYVSVEAGGLILDAGTGVTVRPSGATPYEIGDRFNAIQNQIDDMGGGGGYDPATQTLTIPDMDCTSANKCGECEGDCFSHDDCKAGFYCAYKNPIIDRHPGCARTDVNMRVCVSRKHQLAVKKLTVDDERTGELLRKSIGYGGRSDEGILFF